ncbi:SHD1 domain-containing protein [Anatilimnocola sp. NA78]|uniref:SHD1 domain-containing protein n=1 Tax=Anatilimnocola sp. NA78 TaxID=3415683 RepID=UPI003CE4E2C7
MINALKRSVTSVMVVVGLACLAGNVGCGSKTTWNDVVAEKVRLRVEMTTSANQLRNQFRGNVPTGEQSRFIERIRGMDQQLQLKMQAALRDSGPAPTDIADNVNAPLVSEARSLLAGEPPTMAQNMPPGGMGVAPGMMPPGAMGPGMMPPGMMPPGGMAPGMNPGMMPPGMMPPGGPGMMPGGPGMAGPQFDAKGFEEARQRGIEQEIAREASLSQNKEADRIRDLIIGYHKSPSQSSGSRREQTLVPAQRDIIDEMQAIEKSLRTKQLTPSDKSELMVKQSELEVQFNKLGREERDRLQLLADAAERQRQEQERIEREKQAEELRKVSEVRAREFALAQEVRRKAEEESALKFAAKMAEINKERDEARRVADAHAFTESINRERKKRNLAPLPEAMKPIKAPLTNKSLAPGFEVAEMGQVKPKDAVYVHSDGHWHDAKVKTKRGKFVEIIHIALENTETVTLDRLRLKKNPDPAAEAANGEAVAAKPAEEKEPLTKVWTNSTGTFSVEAELLGFEKGLVMLKRKDGGLVNVPLDRLSEIDQAVIKKLYPQ